MNIEELRRLLLPGILATHESGPPKGAASSSSSSLEIAASVPATHINRHPSGWPILDVIRITEPEDAA